MSRTQQSDEQRKRLCLGVPVGSPSRGGDVTVYVPDINQPSLSTPFYSVLVSVSVFMALSSVYLSELLRVYSPSRQLRSSSDSRTLRIQHIKTKTFGQRSFSHAAPSVWNSLPYEIRHIQSTTAFETALKTHLFKSYLY